MTDGLVCDGLSVGYNGVAVARNLDLEVRPGEVVALLGPNGAGKTTLLLTLSGILQPIAGTATFFGTSILGVLPERLARNGLVHVPDDRSLFGGLTTFENIDIARRPGGMTLEDAFDTFPALRTRAKMAARSLSGGEQQMLAMCRALVQAPKVLMVDEMSMGLAPAIVQNLLSLLRRVADTRGVGVLLVEQHVHLAMAFADRAYVLNHGEIVLTGAAADLRQYPDRLEAAYLGRTVV